MSITALFSIPVGVIVERYKATSPWLDYVWRPASVLTGVPAAEPWTLLGDEGGGKATYFAGAATIELHRTETANYIDNIASGVPQLWVVLRPTGAEPPYQVLAVTADPAEGEAFTETGTYLVETVPMPPAVAEIVEAFIAQHHVERPFFKRKRDRAVPGGRPSGSGRTEPER